jgi:NAD(P)-dependent dehydrogenase (short-subunit alcohol dehydrogenase family)
MEPTSTRPLAGSTALVTGATRGIGYATAEALARMGATVIVHGRDDTRVRGVCARLRQSAPNMSIDGVVADLDSLAGVRRLAAQVGDEHERLDILINNAGLVTRRRQLTVDGIERQLAVNHLAPFLLTGLLLDKLRSSGPARIVNVASQAHRRGQLDFDDLNWERRKYSGIGAYRASKLANILFTRELARRLDGTRVTANCLHPGVVATHIFTGMGLLGRIFGIVSKPFLLPSTKGAGPSVYLASADEVAGTSGRYFNESQAVEPSAAARDDAAARQLWTVSERLAGTA